MPDEQFMPQVRELYEQGAPVKYLRRKYHLSESELQDMAPEEFDETFEPESDIGGY